MNQPAQYQPTQRLQEQLDRIEANQKEIIKGFKIQEQLDRIEGGMKEIAEKQGERSDDEEKLKAFAAEIKATADGIQSDGAEISRRNPGYPNNS